MTKHLTQTNGRQKKTARATSSASCSGPAIDTTAIAAETEVARGRSPSQTDLPRSTPDMTLLATCKPLGNGPEPTVGAEPLLHGGQESLPSELPEREAGSISLVRRATGPQTERGKAVSRKNALKFGIFSRELVVPQADWIPTETKRNFVRLLNSYVDHYRPEGPVEMHLIEIAVGSLWRYRRLLRAETGEIHNHKRILDRTQRLNGIKPSAELDRCSSIPYESATERLPRYETHLLRIYFRALNELERLQRMRLGDTVPSPLVVAIDGDSGE